MWWVKYDRNEFNYYKIIINIRDGIKFELNRIKLHQNRYKLN